MIGVYSVICCCHSFVVTVWSHILLKILRYCISLHLSNTVYWWNVCYCSVNNIKYPFIFLLENWSFGRGSFFWEDFPVEKDERCMWESQGELIWPSLSLLGYIYLFTCSKDLNVDWLTRLFHSCNRVQKYTETEMTQVCECSCTRKHFFAQAHSNWPIPSLRADDN